MTKNKIIFGTGKIPKASDFALGELVINVTDQKVFSKDKTNTVFEIQGAASTSTPSNIDTGSFYLSSSFNSNIITFNQGDGGTDSIDLSSLTAQDNDWYIDTSNSRLTSSLSIFVDGDITSSGILNSSYIKLTDRSLPIAEKGIIVYSASNFYAGIE
jgi:hypothetical protein